MRKPAFCLCENKEQIRYREADQRPCFRYRDGTILSLIFPASSCALWLYSPVCAKARRKPRRSVFSCRGSEGAKLVPLFICFMVPAGVTLSRD